MIGCGRAHPQNTSWFWRDWFYVATPAGMAALTAMVAHPEPHILIRPDARCWGLCPEEQVEAQLTLRNVSLVPLNWGAKAVVGARVARLFKNYSAPESIARGYTVDISKRRCPTEAKRTIPLRNDFGKP